MTSPPSDGESAPLPETTGASTAAGRQAKAAPKRRVGDYALMAFVALLSFVAVILLFGAAQQIGLGVFGSAELVIPWVELGVGLLAAAAVWALIRRG
jgi:hypothetical protein